MTLDQDPGLIPSKRFDVWRRLYTRFLLEPRPATVGVDVGKTIIPVTVVDLLLVRLAPQSAAQDISASAGAYVAFHTVPSGTRWVVKAYVRDTTTAATRVSVNINGTFLTITGSQTASQENNNVDWQLNEGDSIGLVTTGNGADSARRLTVLVEEQDAF